MSDLEVSAMKDLYLVFILSEKVPGVPLEYDGTAVETVIFV